MRLNRYLASCGLGSRRSCESLIRDGRVLVNGEICRELATQVEAGDRVVCDGRALRPLKLRVIALHKPKGYVCSRDDELSRRTIYDLLPAEFGSLHYIGRLDRESEGLLLLTNSGSLTQHLAHPRHKVQKEYLVMIDQALEPRDLARMIEGIETPEGIARAVEVEALAKRQLRIVLVEGKKRQIRHMLDTLGASVRRLVRIRVGPIEIGHLEPGRWRHLAKSEIDSLMPR